MRHVSDDAADGMGVSESRNVRTALSIEDGGATGARPSLAVRRM
jgi:hypothetical protein